MKWRGEFIIQDLIFKNEILSTGLNFLGGVLTNSNADYFGSIRVTDSTETESVTKALASCTFAVDGNTLTVTSTAEFTAAELDFTPAYAFLVSTDGVDIAQAALTAAAGVGMVLTRRDIFEVNA